MDSISKATKRDIPELVTLVNSAYRGEKAKKGWTHEADLVEGEQRIDEPELRKLLQNPGATMLKFGSGENLVGCVYLEKRNELLYLGMLTVSPERQLGGIGKQLLQAAEAHAMQTHCTAITMNVISQRQELITWYEKYGYRRTGERKPFPSHPRFGMARQPLEFVILQKEIHPPATLG